jgi:hypothetical protein
MGERPASAGRARTGRRLAYAPRRLRKPSSAASGRWSRGARSRDGSPTAPSSTASAAATAARVSAGNTCPVAW